MSKKIEKFEITPYDSQDNSKKDYIIVKNGCKLCNSPFRKEAEEIYEEDRNVLKVKKFLDEEVNGKKRLDVSYPAVRQHIYRHYEAQQHTKILREFAEDVNKYLPLQSSPEGSLRRKIAILERDMIWLAAKSDELGVSERRKNSEVVKKLADTILTYESKLEDMKNRLEPYEQVLVYLTEIVREEMKKMEEKEDQQKFIPILNNIVNQLKEKIEKNF